MNKLFKKLFAPIAIFSMALGVTISVSNLKQEVGAKAATYTDTLQITGWGGYTSNSFSAVGTDRTGTATTSGASVAMQIFNGQTGAVRGNQSSMSGNFNVRNTTEYPGYIRKITLKASSTGSNYIVTEAARSLLSLAATPFDGTNFPTSGAITADVISSTLYTATWTVPVGTNFKYFKLHSLKTAGTVLCAGTDALTIEYESVAQSFGTLDRIEVSGGKRDYVAGETFTTDGLLVTAFDTTNLSKSVTSYTTNKNGYTFLNTDVGTVTITVSYTEGTTKTASFDVSVSELKQFSKITAESSLHFGAEYLIVSEGTTASVMTTTYTTFFGRSDVTISSNTIVQETTYQVLKLVISPSTGSFGFQFVNGAEAGKYLALTSNANNLNSDATLTAQSSWFVTFDGEGNVLINSVAFPARNVKYNAGSPRFATYTSSQTSIQLFLNQESVNHTTAATMFAAEVNTGKGNTANTPTQTCAATYAMLDSVYVRLSSGAKSIVDTSSDLAFVNARARMAYLSAWVAANPSGRQVEFLLPSSRNNLIAIVTIGGIAITSLLGYYIVSKKKLFSIK